MTDVNQEDNDDAYDPTQPQDYGDYNPESIDYEAQDDDSAQEEAEYLSDNATNEPVQDPGYVETVPQTVAQPPRSPITSRSPVASLSPTAIRQYDNTEAQNPQPIQTTTNDHTSITSSDTIKSPTIVDVNDNTAIPSSAPKETSQDSSSLPKSVDLQALLAGLVPAKKIITPNSPPQARDRPQPVAPQPNPSGNLPSPAMNLPPYIMYQLQNLTSPPPQTAPQFQQPPQNQAPPVQSGPVDIQPQDLALTPEEEHLYERFLQNEREVVQNANWDDFAYGSRMFIGNLPSERMGKKEIFRLFYPYGRLAQISIKQAYGFVQFYEKQDCENAIRAQQGMILTGRKVHLEISKPQKQKHDGDGGRGNRNQRNRSPIGRDRSPPGRGGRGGRNRGGRGGYDDVESRGRQASRDFSPPGGRYGRRDDDYRRPYSRSRSPLPARYPGSPPRRPVDPPEVALLVQDDPDRGYIRHVEDMFEDRRIRTDTVFVTPRASVPDLTRQMVLDGALAVVFLSRPLQDRRKISMQTFQRNPADPGAIKWDEYNEIDIPVAVDLVAAMKRGPPVPQQQPPYAGYPPQQHYAPPVQPQPPQLPAGVNPNLANIIGSMDPAALQKVFGAIASQQVPAAPAPAYGVYNQSAVPGILGQGSVLQGFGGQGRAAQPPTQQVQDIMAQLAALSKK